MYLLDNKTAIGDVDYVGGFRDSGMLSSVCVCVCVRVKLIIYVCIHTDTQTHTS